MKTLLLASLIATAAHAQTACVVDVVFPDRTDSYASAECVEAWQCYPSPEGCHTTGLSLALPLVQSTLAQQLPYSVPALDWEAGLAYGHDIGSQYIVDDAAIADGALLNPAPGYYVLMVADPIFADSMESP